MPPPPHDKLRNSPPPLLARLQGWLKNEQQLRKLLGLQPDQALEVLRLRRNYKFRKLSVQAGSKRYVCYTHYWPRGLRNLAWFSEQAQRSGVPVPQPLHIRSRWADFLSEGSFTLVLPYIEGQHLSRNSDDQDIIALGHCLGRMHDITAPDWGPLMTNFPKYGNYYGHLQRYWRRSARQLRKHAGFAHKQEIKQVIVWLTEHGQFLSHLSCFNLTHGDPASGNILIDPAGALWLIDCDRIAFEAGPMELANALFQGYCAGDTGRRIRLVEAYLATCPPQTGALWEQHAQFFIAAALLWRSQRKLRWTRKRPDKGRSLERAERAWQQLLPIIQARLSNWQAAVRLLDDQLSPR